MVTSSIEHKSVLAACQRLEEQGFEVTYVDPTPEGLITADRIAEHLREDTLLVSVMWANNEIGTINPIEPIGALCRQRGVFFHTDATQLIGKLSADVQTAGADLLSFSAHKIYGPKGIAALYARRRNPRVRLQPLIDGGGQERGLRGGTLNVPGIVGFGAACELCRREMADDARRLSALRDTLEARLADRLDPIAVNGCRRSRLPHTTNVSFLGVEAEQLIAAVPQVALSSGSACTTTAIQSSYVLRRMGLGEDRARSSIRFGLGRSTTADQIDRAVEHIVRGVTEGAARSAASCRGAL